MKRFISRRRATGILGAAATTLLIGEGHAQTGNVTERVTKLVVEHLGVERKLVTTDASFEKLGADSLDCTELVMAAEEEFGIEIPEAVAAKIRTVGQMVSHLESAAKPAPRPSASGKKNPK